MKESSSSAAEGVSSETRGRAATLLYLVTLFVLIAAQGIGRTQQSSPSRTPSADPYTLKVNVDMVVLRATAEDHRKALVSGLDKNDFQVYEDGGLQPVN